MHPILIIPGISTAITVFTPFRWVWRFWLVVAIAVTTLFGLSPSDPDPGIDHVLGLIILFEYFVLSGLLFLLRAAFHMWRTRMKGKVSTPDLLEAAIIRYVDLSIWFGSGCVAAVFIVIFLGQVFAAVSYGILVHFSIFMVSSGAIVAIWRSSRLKQQAIQLHVLAFTVPGLSILAVATVLSVFYPLRVLAEARKTASDNPYCIEMSSRGRDVRSWQDIMFFTMDKNMRPHGRHHAILLVDRDGEILPFHWSYRTGKFVSGVVNWNNHNKPSVACRPKRDFGPALGLTSSQDPEFKELYFNGKHLRIPISFEPRWSGAYLSIGANSPDFSPTERVVGRLGASMAIRDQTWLQSWANEDISGQLTGESHELVEVRNAKYGDQAYYRTNESGEILTLVNCYDSRPIEIRCQHRFYRDGRVYSFAHSRELLDQSSQMEERLIQVFSSFETE